MGKRRTRQKAEIQEHRPSRIPLLILVVMVYFATVILFVSLLTVKHVPVYLPGPFRQPNCFLLTVWALYYVFPFFLAAAFGWLFRPFWKNFRNVLITIFYAAIVYSFVFYMLHSHYYRKRYEDIHQDTTAKMDVEYFRHAPGESGQDLDFTMRFTMPGYAPGTYRLAAEVTEYSDPPRASRIGEFDFSVEAERPARMTGHFRFRSKDFPAGRNSGREFVVGLVLQKVFPVNLYGQRVLTFFRWAPFFRVTDWEGADPLIKDEILTLEVLNGVDSFFLPPGRP